MAFSHKVIESKINSREVNLTPLCSIWFDSSVQDILQKIYEKQSRLSAVSATALIFCMPEQLFTGLCTLPFNNSKIEDWCFWNSKMCSAQHYWFFRGGGLLLSLFLKGTEAPNFAALGYEMWHMKSVPSLCWTESREEKGRRRFSIRKIMIYAGQV